MIGFPPWFATTDRCTNHHPEVYANAYQAIFDFSPLCLGMGAEYLAVRTRRETRKRQLFTAVAPAHRAFCLKETTGWPVFSFGLAANRAQAVINARRLVNRSPR